LTAGCGYITRPLLVLSNDKIFHTIDGKNCTLEIRHVVMVYTNFHDDLQYSANFIIKMVSCPISTVQFTMYTEVLPCTRRYMRGGTKECFIFCVAVMVEYKRSENSEWELRSEPLTST